MDKNYCSVNNWLVDLSSGSLRHIISGERKRLGEYQLKLLELLALNAGKTFTREELTTRVWEHRVIGNNSLPNAIHALRTALEDDGKHQRIIKTIPKKGYLLEAEYCHFINPQDVTPGSPFAAAAPAIVTREKIPFPPAAGHRGAPLYPGESKPIGVLPVPSHFSGAALPLSRRTLAVLLILVALLSAGAGWYFTRERIAHPVVKELLTGAWSNIRLFEITDSRRAFPEEAPYSRLQNTFATLNPLLRERAVTMQVYVRRADLTLNYTLVLNSRCDSRQLVMNIHHWRIDPASLNKLILQETRRKLDEMGLCEAA